MEIGAQLYTLREFCQTEEGLFEALKKVADIGYTNVQLSGGCDVDGEKLAKVLKENGLKCVLTHTKPDKLQGDINELTDFHNAIGCKYIGLGYYSYSAVNVETEYSTFLSKYKPVAEKIKNSGKYFMYHNHNKEFMKIGNKTVLEKISEDFSKDELGFILDTYWVQNAGGDPAYWIEKLSYRLPCIHLKDHDFEGKMMPIGKGNINFERVFAACEKAGTEYMLVEQDNCNGENPYDCLKLSFEYLKSFGF